MKKMLIIFLILLIFIVFAFFKNETYQLKIQIKIENVNPKDLDENFAKNIEKEILNLGGVKDLILFSSKYGINIYCKFNCFANKNELINRINRLLNAYDFEDISFNEKYHLKYNCFLVVHSNDNDYYLLENKANLIFEEILKLKIANNIKIFGSQKKVLNIYVTDDDFIKYDLSISDIKTIIKSNNLKYNIIADDYFKSIDSDFKSVDDVENIFLNFKNSKLSFQLKDIFKIKKEIKKPIESSIYWNNKAALVIGISLKKFYPIWLLKLRFKNYNVEVINPRKIMKTEIYLGENSNFNSLYEKYLKIEKQLKGDALYFLALEAPKINNIENFDEIKNNRIIIFSNNFNYKNNDVLFAPTNMLATEYLIDKAKLNKFSLSKQDVFDSIIQNSGGVFCDYFYDGDDKIEIFLKNDSDFIYSKKNKNLISKDEVLKIDTKNAYNLVVRKNFKNIELIKTKNPSIFRRVQLQIR